MEPWHTFPSGRQGGAALVIALIFLVVMALIGLSASNVTFLEERMAGNMRDRELAFQTAEAALAYARQNWKAAPLNYSGTLTNPATNTATTGVCDHPIALGNPAHPAAGLRHIDLDCGNDQAYWNAHNWANDSIQLPAGSVVTAPGQDRPRFLIERLANTGALPNICQHLRVTARGIGAQDATIVILQEQSECCSPGC